MDTPTPPVLYDGATRNRCRGFLLVLFLGLVPGMLMILVVSMGLAVCSKISFLGIAAPQMNSRAVPNVVREPSGNQARTSFDGRAFSDQRGSPRKDANVRSTKMLAFHVNWDKNSLVSLKANIGSIDVLVPEWLHLSSGGSVSVDDPERMDSTLALIRSEKPDLSIMPLINNFNNETQSWDRNLLSQAIGTESSRRKLIRNLIDFNRKHGFSGISIDFEAVPKKEQANLSLFMAELYAEFHKAGLQVSQNIPLDDDAFDAKELGKSVDFLILMAYDEHSTYSTSAGPVASQGWFARALDRRFKELPAEKYAVSIGGYGYDWVGNSQSGKNVTFDGAMRVAQDSKATVAVDASSLNTTYSYRDVNNVLHHVWLLDAVSAFNQMKATRALGSPYGYVLWRLGSEDPDIWNIIPKKDAPDDFNDNEYRYSP